MPPALPTILFDDAAPGSTEWTNLAPLTDLRPAFDLRTGARTTLDRHANDPRLRILSLDTTNFFAGAPATATGLSSRSFTTQLADAAPTLDEPTLELNSRCPILPDEALTLKPGQCILEASSRTMVAALLNEEQRRGYFKSGAHGMIFHDELVIDRPLLLHRPWDIIRFRDACIAHDLAHLLAHAPHNQRANLLVDGDPALLRIHPDAHIAPGVVFDTRQGPIIVGKSEIQGASVIAGPVVIHDHCVITARSFIKANTVLGPTCKVGGEVGGTIFQGLANKVHDGHLGDSFVGEWANLGAGTTNSNLLNTYDEVITRVSPRHPNERTGIRYLGAIIGDHAKFAINTRIMTGAVIGTGSMIASSQGVMKSTGRFRWITDDRDSLYRFDKFLAVAKTVMARRHITPDDHYIARLQHLHTLERANEK